MNYRSLNSAKNVNSEVQVFCPMSDPRWPEFLAQHKHASVFHTREWLAALQKCYGYDLVGYTTSLGADISNGVLFCKVNSWITGRRLVSLPFSDHCQPLAKDHELTAILNHIHHERLLAAYRYVEVRPLTEECFSGVTTPFEISKTFRIHRIDLRPEVKDLYNQMHDSCIRRKIRRAEREQLQYMAGQNQAMLSNFYRLLLLTRRRHQLPPQPREWFEALLSELGSMITIHVISKDHTAVASMITLRYKDVVVYKYGCSDERVSSLGGTALLFWKVIQQAKASGAKVLDLGRSDKEDTGLSTFKERLGGIPSELNYFRDVPDNGSGKMMASESSLWARKTFSRMPDAILIAVGKMAYKHLG